MSEEKKELPGLTVADEEQDVVQYVLLEQPLDYVKVTLMVGPEEIELPVAGASALPTVVIEPAEPRRVTWCSLAKEGKPLGMCIMEGAW